MRGYGKGNRIGVKQMVMRAQVYDGGLEIRLWLRRRQGWTEKSGIIGAKPIGPGRDPRQHPSPGSAPRTSPGAVLDDHESSVMVSTTVVEES